MNINPKIWGRNTWEFFYYVSLSYPKNPSEETKELYKNFLILAGKILPCEKCRNNFAKHVQDIPIENHLNSAYDLFSWVVKMDNKVRKYHNRKEYTIDESLKYYMNKVTPQSESFLTSKEKILFGLGTLILIMFVLNKFKL